MSALNSEHKEEFLSRVKLLENGGTLYLKLKDNYVLSLSPFLVNRKFVRIFMFIEAPNLRAHLYEFNDFFDENDSLFNLLAHFEKIYFFDRAKKEDINHIVHETINLPLAFCPL